MNLEKVIPLLTVQKPSVVFKKVVAFNKEAKVPSQRVQVRLGLASGFEIVGVPLAIDQDGNTIVAGVADTITYVNAGSVSGIELLTPTALLGVLTDDRYVAVPQNEVPTLLAIKRKIHELSAQIKTSYAIDFRAIDWSKQCNTDVEKYQFDTFLNVLSDVLKNIAGDTMGKEALKTISSIEITLREGELSVVKGAAGIAIQLDVNRKLKKDLKQVLQQQLEKYL